MSIERADFDQLAEADLQELVTAGVPESLRIEYKATTYGGADADKREFAKDISALANTQGGHLLIGIAAEEGVAVRLEGIEGIVADRELQRLEQLASSGLEPRISGLRMKAVRMSNGRTAIAMRVPRSWRPPHRVIMQGSNRFFMRHSTGAYEPNVEELRTLFTATTSALERARTFRSARIKTIQAETGDRPLVGGGRLILHVVPVARVTVDVAQALAHAEALPPINSAGRTSRFNYYGFINERGGDQNNGYTQVYRDGTLEATNAGIVRTTEGGLRVIPGLVTETSIVPHVCSYINALQNLGVPPPLIVMITLEGVGGARYIVTEQVYDDDGVAPPLPENVLTLPELTVEDYGDDVSYHRALRPAIDALWNAAGRASARTFDSTGRWTGRLRR